MPKQKVKKKGKSNLDTLSLSLRERLPMIICLTEQRVHQVHMICERSRIDRLCCKCGAVLPESKTLAFAQSSSILLPWADGAL